MDPEPKVIGTCPLCHRGNVTIIDSHLIPRWTYKRIRPTTGKNRNPMHVVDGKALQLSNQAKEYLLCGACDQRLGNLDDWAARSLYQKTGKAPLVQRCTRGAGTLVLADDDAYQLALFCLSIFWRGHASKSLNTDLGRFGEIARRYLLGSSLRLPRQIVLIVRFCESSPGKSDIAELVTTPETSQNGDRAVHRFYMCGLEAIMNTGWNVPEIYRPYCLMRSSPRRMIVVPTDDIIEWLAEPFAEGMAWRIKRGYEQIPKGLL